ncbi:hypothetical protein [Streptomyces sp. NBC_01233]|uniref:hypothetical protein n=1 Tax=Streptomyces sp. NBC_01233 TaxID=2903787 RepID=UPI002E11460A|nr:hypothetical protein OG332_39460 [Streptomyces sp. NBC_01233]
MRANSFPDYSTVGGRGGSGGNQARPHSVMCGDAARLVWSGALSFGLVTSLNRQTALFALTRTGPAPRNRGRAGALLVLQPHVA